jgi:hypothetical protein
MATDPRDQLRRDDLERGLRDELNGSVKERVDRFLEVNHQSIIPNHHFAPASSECVNLYRDGYMLSAVMVSQAVAEGVWRFVLERNSLAADEQRPALATLLVDRSLITQDCADAFTRMWRSFRNDVHHMNPSVVTVPFRELAKRNLADLALIEREIFAVTFNAGALVPVQRKYWDLNPEGTTSVFLRLD